MKGRIQIESEKELNNVGFYITVKNTMGMPVAMSKMDKPVFINKGLSAFDFEMDTSMLAPDNYLVAFALYIDGNQVIDVVRNGFFFEVVPNEGFNDGYRWNRQLYGNVSGFSLKRIK